MRLHIIRHGQTDDNVAGIIQGQKDTPLNDHGRKEASLVSARLASIPFSEIWSSPLSRASETAEVIAQPHGLSVQTHPGLMERGLGSLEGRVRLAGEALPADIEAGDKFRQRIIGWFTNFLSTHRDTNSTDSTGPICIVSHGAFITTLLSILLAKQHFGFGRGDNVNLMDGCYNTMIMEVECRLESSGSGKWTGEVQSWGDVAHLEGLDSGGGHSGSVADEVKA